MTSLIQTSQFRWPIRIYYEDTDAGGLVYHANYLKYFERARTECLRQFGLNQQTMSEHYQAMFVLKSAAVEYHRPAKLDDELMVTADIEKLGKASLIFVQKIWRGAECLVDGRFKVGCVDTVMVRPRAIPSVVIDALNTKHPAPTKPTPLSA